MNEARRARVAVACGLTFSLLLQPLSPVFAQVVAGEARAVAPVAPGAVGAVPTLSISARSLTPTLGASLALPAEPVLPAPAVAARPAAAAAVPAVLPQASAASAAPIAASPVPARVVRQTGTDPERDTGGGVAAFASLRKVTRRVAKTSPAPLFAAFFDGTAAQPRSAVADVSGRAATGRPGLAPSSWWRDPARSHAAVSVPLYALRRAEEDPGIGKFTDLGRTYRDVLAKEGVDVVHLLPHFALKGESPYAPVSLRALNEDNVDWAAVPEVGADPALKGRLTAPSGEARSVDYAALRAREGAVADAAWARFKDGELARGGARGRAYQAFAARNAAWLDDYASFMALSTLLGKPALDWTPAEVDAARGGARYQALADRHRFAQWVAFGQMEDALGAIHAAGGHVLFDIPMFRAKDSVDAWRHPEYFKDLRTRNPGIENQWVHESWMDLALWDWTRLKAEGYRPILDPFRHWLDLGFDGGRVDALHFAYDFGDGQLASGDEPGDDYVRALGQVFQERGAFPLAEAFEGKAENAQRFGFVTVYGDWKKLSSHDDPRAAGFMARFLDLSRQGTSGRAGRFIAYTLGDEWGDPVPVKQMAGRESHWRYRIPLPADADYAARAPSDVRAQLGALMADLAGDVWTAGAAVWQAFAKAGASFVKVIDGTARIWAASLDWFLEEWGRDTFISLPGLLLATGRSADAEGNIRRFARLERDGLIPNRIPDGGDGPEYNTVDGSLWFVQAVRRASEASGDAAFAAEMLPVVRRILGKYASGTGYQRYGRFNRIAMDSDGLIVSPAQATWMDADPDGRDRPVTPRDGKAVEINALWYAGLRYLARLERQAGNAAAADTVDARAELVKRSFNQEFWFATDDNRRAWGGSGGALRDVVGGDPHGDAIRPNMLFAVSVGGDLLSADRRAAVVLAATKDLLTPYGLRTLSPRDSMYRSRYDTSQPPIVKDQAYHQGTAWPWLMGAYVDALAQVRRDQGWGEARIREEARAVVTPLVEFLVRSPEGSLPEVFDGGDADAAVRDFRLDDPAGLAPFMARLARAQNRGGTRSQAWSVAELMRVLSERGLK